MQVPGSSADDSDPIEQTTRDLPGHDMPQYTTPPSFHALRRAEGTPEWTYAETEEGETPYGPA